ncbi:putative toxin-antitoxin system toxin component, PIN family [Scytonema sp. NUACC26]|uniref:putative toxin-antitoxin system toxin component, PIN family n=1 Tax=Scytonema sp. NUACC26 TaxID=3140176 RepID=UPI0034DC1F26
MNVERLFVLDANIIISAVIIKKGKARQALDKAQIFGRVLMSMPVLSEIEEVLNREKFDKYITVIERKLFLASFVKTVKFVEITENIDICREPKDNKYLELALSGQATCIISGDNDLLVLHPFQEISILTIQQFLELEVT